MMGLLVFLMFARGVVFVTFGFLMFLVYRVISQM